MHADYTIRATRTDDIDALPPIEQAASRLFANVGWDIEQSFHTLISAEAHRAYAEQGRSWIAVNAADQPVGFAVAAEMDGHAHLDELDVHPDHGRRGIGRALVEQVCAWAHETGYAAVTLTTERNVPWNAPFYATMGFQIIAPDDLHDELRAQLAKEAEWAPTPETRVAMIRPLV